MKGASRGGVDARWASYRQIVKNTIEKHRWMVQMVAPTVEQADNLDCSPFVYSIGLTESFGHPELIMIGINPQSGGRIINSAGDLIKDGERLTLPDGVDVKYMDNLFGNNYRAAIKKVTRPAKLANLCQAANLYGDDGFEALQIVMPDKNGNFPWDEGYDSQAMRKQKLLY
jgi:hypothetical protein